MRRWLVCILAVCLLSCSTRLHPAALNDTDPPGALSANNTRITFIGTALTVSHEGTFTHLNGEFDSPTTQPADARLAVEIDMNSIYTEIPLLTKHLIAEDFFDVGRFPKSTFVSTRIEPDGSRYKVIGQFTIHGVARRQAFAAQIRIEKATAELTATFIIRQSDYGMQSARTTSDEVPVTVQLKVRRKQF